jgi:predicted HTH domain antitoxin
MVKKEMNTEYCRMEVLDMCSIAVQIPEEVLYDIKITEEQANDFAKRSIAMMLYTQNHISIGYSAQIAGMTEEEFIKYLSSNGVSIFNFDDEEEFLEEMNNA